MNLIAARWVEPEQLKISQVLRVRAAKVRIRPAGQGGQKQAEARGTPRLCRANRDTSPDFGTHALLYFSVR